MKPARSILSPDFKYVSSDHTNLSATFARVRAELAKQPAQNVRPITTPKERKATP